MILPDPSNANISTGQITVSVHLDDSPCAKPLSPVSTSISIQEVVIDVRDTCVISHRKKKGTMCKVCSIPNIYYFTEDLVGGKDCQKKLTSFTLSHGYK